MILYSFVLLNVCLMMFVWRLMTSGVRVSPLKTFGFVMTMSFIIYIIGFGSWDYLILKHIIIYSIGVGYFSALYNRKPLATFYDWFSIVTLFNFIQMIQLLIYRLFYPTYASFSSNLNCYRHIFLLNGFLIVIALVFYFFQKPLQLFKRYRHLCEEDTGFFSNVLFISLLVKYKFFYFREGFWTHYFVVFFAIVLLLFFLIESGIKRQQNISFYKKNNVYLHYYDVLIDLLNRSRKQQHEFKNHLEVIGTLAKSSALCDLDIYISKLTSLTFLDMHEFLMIENKILAALIYSKREKAKKLGIVFEFDLYDEPKMPLDDHEFVEVIGNLIENAFESLSDFDAHFKKVILEIKSVPEGFMIRTINFPNTLAPENIQLIFEENYSTKSIHRGYGLSIVKEHVERYKGKLLVHITEKSTVFSILFEK